MNSLRKDFEEFITSRCERSELYKSDEYISLAEKSVELFKKIKNEDNKDLLSQYENIQGQICFLESYYMYAKGFKEGILLNNIC
jgi:hypothetical protein